MGHSFIITGTGREEPDLLQVGWEGGRGDAACAVIPCHACFALYSIRRGALASSFSLGLRCSLGSSAGSQGESKRKHGGVMEMASSWN